MWLAVDSKQNEFDNLLSREHVFTTCPKRQIGGYWSEGNSSVRLTEGTIKRLIGKELTWEDEPVPVIGYNTLLESN